MLHLLHTQSLVTEALLLTWHVTPTHIVISDNDGGIYILSSQKNEPATIKEEKQRAWALTIGDDSASEGESSQGIVIGGMQDGEIATYSLEDGSRRRPFPRVHQTGVQKFLTLDSRLISADGDGLIIIWDLKARSVLTSLTGHTASPMHLECLGSPADTQDTLVSASYDGSTRLWDLNSGQQKMILETTDPPPTVELGKEQHSTSSPKNKSQFIFTMILLGEDRVITGGLGGHVRIWDIKAGTLLATWQAHFNGNPRVGPVLNRMILHPSGKALITTGTDGCIRMWDLKTHSLLREVEPFEKSVTSVLLYKNIMLCGGKDGGDVDNACGLFNRVVMWDVSSLAALPKGEQERQPEQLGMNCEYVHGIEKFGSDIAILLIIKGHPTVQVWGEKE